MINKYDTGLSLFHLGIDEAINAWIQNVRDTLLPALDETFKTNRSFLAIDNTSMPGVEIGIVAKNFDEPGVSKNTNYSFIFKDSVSNGTLSVEFSTTLANINEYNISDKLDVFNTYYWLKFITDLISYAPTKATTIDLTGTAKISKV